MALHAWRHYAVTLRQARLEGLDAKQPAGDVGWALRDSGDDSEEEEGGGEGEEDADEEEDDDEDDGAVRITPAAQRRLSARVAALSAVSSPPQPSALAPPPTSSPRLARRLALTLNNLALVPAPVLTPNLPRSPSGEQAAARAAEAREIHNAVQA